MLINLRCIYMQNRTRVRTAAEEQHSPAEHLGKLYTLIAMQIPQIAIQ